MKREEWEAHFDFVTKEIGLLAFCNDEDIQDMKADIMFELYDKLTFVRDKIRTIKKFDD